MVIGAGCVLGAFVCGVIFSDKIKAYAQLKIDAVKAKFKV